MKRFCHTAFVPSVVALASLILAAADLDSALGAAKRPVNLLFLITDQQRWDALSCAGNQVLKTPNLDRMRGRRGLPTSTLPARFVRRRGPRS